jgi:hypothetical protein
MPSYDFSPEDGESMFLQNAGVYLQIYMALKPRKTPPTPSYI